PLALPLGPVAMAGLPPTLAAGPSVAAPLGLVAVSGLVPSASSSVSTLAPVGHVTVAGLAPTTGVNVTVAASSGLVTNPRPAEHFFTLHALAASPAAGRVLVTGFAPGVLGDIPRSSIRRLVILKYRDVDVSVAGQDPVVEVARGGVALSFRAYTVQLSQRIVQFFSRRP